MKEKVVEVCGVKGRGASAAAARADAQQQINVSLHADYTPFVMHHKGYVCTVWREPLLGWTHRTWDQSSHCASLVDGGHEPCRDVAIDYAALDLCQLTWTGEDGDALPPLLWVFTAHVAAEWRSWVSFQLRCLEAQRNGLSGVDITDWAARNPWRPELWREAAAAV